jgi:hypothetical protein
MQAQGGALAREDGAYTVEFIGEVFVALSVSSHTKCA